MLQRHATGGLGGLSAALLSAALSLQGCSLITIGYCPGFKIENGQVLGAWQHDPVAIKCDDGYAYLGSEVTCDEFQRTCTWEDGNKICKTKVGMLVKAAPSEEHTHRRLAALPVDELSNSSNVPTNNSHGNATRSGEPAKAVLKCSEKGGDTGPAADVGAGASAGYTLGIPPSFACQRHAKQVEAWARKYFRTWNHHNGSAVAALFAPAGWARSWDHDIVGARAVGNANQDIFDEMPNISIEVSKVHPLAERRAAFVEMLIETNDGTDKTFNATDYMEFAPHGNITAMHGSLAAISVRLKAVDSHSDLDRRSIKVEGMPPNGNDLYLYKVFAPFGAIRHVRTKLEEDGTSTGVGFVDFFRATDAEKAIAEIDKRSPDKVERIETIPSNSGAVLRVSLRRPQDGAEKSE